MQLWGKILQINSLHKSVFNIYKMAFTNFDVTVGGGELTFSFETTLYALYYRITLAAQCEMDFHLYPMDTQRCSLVIESCE